MPASSTFQQAIREAQSSALVGLNVVNKSLPYVGGGMVPTSVGVIGGLSVMSSPMFMPPLGGDHRNLILFFVAQNVAMKGNNATALPPLSACSLITGFTLSGLVALAGASPVSVLLNRRTGHRNHLCDRVDRRTPHEDSVGQALSGVVGLD